MTQPKDFGFDDDAAMLRDTARKFLADNLPTDKLHRLVAANSDPYRAPACDWDPELWRQIVALGWTTVAVPEVDGGMGMNLTALAALAEEVGRAALPSPFIATALAVIRTTPPMKTVTLQIAQSTLDELIAQLGDKGNALILRMVAQSRDYWQSRTNRRHYD